MTTSLVDCQSKLSDWSRAVRGLAKKTGADPAVLQSIQDCNANAGQTVRLALIGAPNVGKSSLMNALLGRRLLPVSSLPSNQPFVVEGVYGAELEHYVARGASHPIDSLPNSKESAAGDPIMVHVRHPWLEARQMSVSERAALDAPEEQLNRAIELSLRCADIVILVIDAETPVRRSETMVMSECARRLLPLIVALNKTDKLSPEDLKSTVTYAEKQVGAYAAQAQMVAVATVPGAADGLDRLTGIIDDWLASADFSLVRFRQACEGLFDALKTITAQATAAREIQNKTREERNQEMRRRQFASAEQAAVWTRIENQLQERRQRLEDEIRNGLRARKESIAGMLLNELETRTNIKTWWEQELPYRLSRELQAAGESLSGVANRRIIADVEWVQSELVRCFRIPHSAIPININVKIQGESFTQKEVGLRDTNTMRIVSRLGQAAAVLVAGGLLLTSSIGGGIAALSILTSLAAEQAVAYTTSKDREKVRELIGDVIEKASFAYVADISQRLRAGYEEIFEALKSEQQRWQSAQSAALKLAATSSAEETDWSQVINESEAIEQEMQESIAAVQK